MDYKTMLNGPYVTLSKSKKEATQVKLQKITFSNINLPDVHP
jgi:hypothetical protein